MKYTAKGIINAIKEIKTTTKGFAVRQIDFRQTDGHLMHPSALGNNIDLLDGFNEGDEIEMEFHISGSKGLYNNIIIDNVTKVDYGESDMV